MIQTPNPFERFWEEILSSDPDLIRVAYASLDADTQQAVILHLRRMAEEEGWHSLQQASARAALTVLEDLDHPITGKTA
ncbi:MAG TPA: hypothetical protein VGJ97_01845 [Anaerolineaceae bacterium]|jgi:hypothetical protein